MSDLLKVLTITEKLIPSNTIGIIRPMLFLQKNGEVEFRMRYTLQYRERDIQWADVVVMCRSIRPEELDIIESARKNGKRLIFDIDDNFFELSADTEIGRFHRFPVHLYVLCEMLRNADAVRVYSRPMEEIAQRYNPNTYRLNSYFDFSLLNGITPQKHDKLRIVYATSRGNADRLSQICTPAVARVLEKYPDRVEFYAFGRLPDQLQHYSNAHKLKYIKGYEKYIRFFAKKGFDIGLAPLLNDRFHNSKTNNKFREYGAMRVCGIYSKAQIYTDCVTDRVNGLLVDNTVDSWYDAICELVENDSLRETIRENARRNVEREYSMESTIVDWRRILKIDGAKKTFKNIRRLKVAVLYDGGIRYRNPRMEELIIVLGFCGMKYTVSDFWRVDLRNLKKFDLCVCFIPELKNVDIWLTALSGYGAKAVIADTMSQFSAPEEYPNVTFTNAVGRSANAFQIPYASNLETVDLSRAALETLATDTEKRDYYTVYKSSIDRVKQSQEETYSVQSPIFLWAQILSRYTGTYYGKRLPAPLGVLNKYVGRPTVRLSRKAYRGLKRMLRPIGRLIGKIIYKAGYWGTELVDYVKVNYLKKY